jgi:hypothetical protein
MPERHTCAAEGCQRMVQTTMLMCREHWYQVPKPIRDRVWAAYNNLQRAQHAEEALSLRDEIAALRVVQAEAVESLKAAGPPATLEA